MLTRNVFKILLFLVTFKFKACQENCTEILVLTGLECECVLVKSDNLVEYSIKCGKSDTSIPHASFSIEIKPVDENQFDSRLIQFLLIVDQKIGHLDDNTIKTPLSLQELELINDEIESISLTTFSKLVNLSKLKLSKNPLKLIDLNVISQLDHLEVLNLNENKLTSIDLDLGNIKHNLQEIHLDNNKLTNLGSFQSFPQLKIISLNNNLLQIISNKTFTNLTNLEKLYLSFNTITVIEPYTFLSLKNLQLLYLDNNNLLVIDDSYFFGLSNLNSIKLKNNKLIKISTGSFVRMSIGSLSLISQNIKSIDVGSISGCNYLRQIDLSKNQIERITPGFIKDLPALSFLTFEHNFVNKLEYDTFGRLDAINTIFLSKNSISTIKAGAFLQLKNLRTLYFLDNLLRELSPDMFIGLDNLDTLRIDKNKLIIINANTFIHVPKLMQLYLTGNYISTIEPNAFSQLVYLRYLSLSQNQILEINANMFKDLTSLNALYLANNKISSISENTFVELKYLMEIDLNGNILKNLNSCVFNGLILFYSSDSVFKLTLERNNFDDINGMFDNFTRLGQIYLASNKIRRIDNRTFKDIKKLTKLSLSFNPLEYVEKNVFDRFGSTLSELYLSGIQANPSEFLNFSAFTQLTILDVSQTGFSITESTFKSFYSSLKNLYLRQIGIRDLNYLYIDRMLNLNTLDLSDNPIEWSTICDSNLSFPFFASNNKLMELFLSNTSLKNLACLGLNKLKALKRIDLSNNLIETIESDIFNFNSPCANTQSKQFYLILSNNLIRFIQPGSFDYICGLQLLKLDGNAIFDDKLIEKSLTNLNSLVNLYLNKSNLNKFPLFDSFSGDEYQLASMDLSHNLIQSIGSNHFKNLKFLAFLNLANNQISHIESTDLFYGTPQLGNLNFSSNLIDTYALSRINFDWCVNLISLNLSYNRISVLESFIFNGLKSLRKIDISYNEIIQIESNTFNKLPKLVIIYLFGIKPKAFSRNVDLRENFISECESLKFVHVSSIDLVLFNIPSFLTTFRQKLANREVNDAIYYKSINIRVENMSYFKSNLKFACQLTIMFINRHVHLNLFDDTSLETFLSSCYSLDLYNESPLEVPMN